MDFSWISNAIDQLTTQYSGLFLVEAHSWLKWLGIIILSAYALKWALVSVSGQGGYDLPGLVQFFVMFSIASFMMAYYDKPLPWVDSTVASILPDTANQLIKKINDAGLAVATENVKTALDSIEDPPSALENLPGAITWIEATCQMQIAQAVMLAVNIVGILAIGVLVLIGSLLIPFFIVPRLSWLFWNLVQSLLEFSFWGVIAAALAFVWATAWSAFVVHAMKGDYSLAHFAQLMPYMFLMSFAMLWSVFFLPSRLTSDVFKGTATAGSNWAAGMAIGIRALR